MGKRERHVFSSLFVGSDCFGVFSPLPLLLPSLCVCTACFISQHYRAFGGGVVATEITHRFFLTGSLRGAKFVPEPVLPAMAAEGTKKKKKMAAAAVV